MKILYSFLFVIGLLGLNFVSVAQKEGNPEENSPTKDTKKRDQTRKNQRRLGQKRNGNIVQNTRGEHSKSRAHKVTFKNESGKDMYVAVAYYDKNPATMEGHCFYTRGWFKVDKGKSIWMNVPGRQFYYHAHQIGKQDVFIGSEKEFFAHPVKKFSIKKADDKHVHAKNKQYKLYKFDKIPASNQVTLK